MPKIVRLTAVSCARAVVSLRRSFGARFLPPRHPHRTRSHRPQRRSRGHLKRSTAAGMEELVGIPAQYLQSGSVA